MANRKNLTTLGVISVFLVVLVAAGAAQGQWIEEQKLLALDGEEGDNFGISVSISGDFCIVGRYWVYPSFPSWQYGSAYIFKHEEDGWVQQIKLLASDSEVEDWFGFSVSISGDYCIIGAYEDDDNGPDSGSAYIFKREGDNWIQQAKLVASNGQVGDRFGWSVSISGDYCIVGAPYSDEYSYWSGLAYIFKREGESWVEEVRLSASDGETEDKFGLSVSIDCNYCIVGAPYDDDNGHWSGSAYIFKHEGESWIEQAKLLALDGKYKDHFGLSVSISGDYCVLGAYEDDDNGTDSGSAYVFKREGENWVQQSKLIASDGQAVDMFGLSVSISDSRCIIGAWRDDDNGDSSGSAYIFNREGETWTEHAKLLASDGQAGDFFGFSVSTSGDRCIVGADRDDDNGSNSGSAYVFMMAEPNNTVAVACIVGGDRAVEVGSGCEARVILDGSCSSDEDSTPGTNDDIVHFDWYKVDPCAPNFEDFLGSGEIIDCNLPLGEHIIVLEVIDKAGAFDTNEVTIIVQDTTPPDFTLSVTPTTLWPVNHKMVQITPSWMASDICDASPEVSLVSITMNEGDEAKGDGHTTDDIQVSNDGSIYLRAGRSGTGNSRIYTITYQAVDDSGNAAVASATVTVPHDQR